MDKVIHWLREKTGFYMLNAHFDGIYDRLKQQDKKIQELEQENEQLKKSIDRIMQNKEIKTIDSEIALLNAELQQENEQLKADIESRTMCITCERELQNCNLQAENERLKEENYQLQKDCQICENFIDFIPCKPIRDMDYDLQKVISQRDNYYQALQEIRDIVSEPCIVDENCQTCNSGCMQKDILAKINEVIGAEQILSELKDLYNRYS